jgi:hypothetical protein
MKEKSRPTQCFAWARTAASWRFEIIRPTRGGGGGLLPASCHVIKALESKHFENQEASRNGK